MCICVCVISLMVWGIMFCVAILGRRNPTELEGTAPNIRGIIGQIVCLVINFQKKTTHSIFIAFLLIAGTPGKITFKKKT